MELQCVNMLVVLCTKSIGAALYHSSEADSDEQQHEMYPRDPNTWCTFHADVANNISFYKKSGGLLPKAAKKIIKPIFMNLGDNELLEKCLHGKTQNNNESLNGMIWKKCPKDVYVGKCVLEMGVSSAVICFNEGKKVYWMFCIIVALNRASSPKNLSHKEITNACS